uniref:Uncharacterized protein n=1 Tax=Setaria italica TaxID=4555 RepID=K3XUK7_SETIT
MLTMLSVFNFSFFSYCSSTLESYMKTAFLKLIV